MELKLVRIIGSSGMKVLKTTSTDCSQNHLFNSEEYLLEKQQRELAEKDKKEYLEKGSQIDFYA